MGNHEKLTRRQILEVIGLLLVALMLDDCTTVMGLQATATPSETVIPSSTQRPSVTASPTDTVTPTKTITPTKTLPKTATATPTATPTSTQTAIPEVITFPGVTHPVSWKDAVSLAGSDCDQDLIYKYASNPEAGDRGGILYFVDLMKKAFNIDFGPPPSYLIPTEVRDFRGMSLPDST